MKQTRREFLKLCGLSALAISLSPLLGCEDEDTPLPFIPDVAEQGKIAIITRSKEDYYRCYTWITNADGSDPIKIAEGSKSSSLKFSPDGRYLVCDSKLFDSEGRELQDIGSMGSPEWSANSSSIYFSQNKHICRYNLNTSKLEELTDTDFPVMSTNSAFDLALSPDQQKLAFIHSHIYYNRRRYNIFVTDKDGRSMDSKFYLDTVWEGTDFAGLSWLNDRDVIFGATDYQSICQLNTQTKALTEVKPEMRFSEIVLSPDRQVLAIRNSSAYYKDTKLYFADPNELASGTLNPQVVLSNNIGAFGWSRDSKYFTIRDQDSLRIFDRDINEYRFSLKDIPDLRHLEQVSWS